MRSDCSARLPSLALLLLGTQIAVCSEPAVPDTTASSSPRIVNLLERLEHPDFAQREAATRQLQELGRESIDALVDAALHRPPEAATRSLQVLESLLLSDNKDVFLPADDGLNQLLDSEQGAVVVAASQVLARHMHLREQRAVAAIRELGGTVQFDLDDPSGDPAQRIFLGPDMRLRPPEIVPRTIILGTKWKGGLEGLRFLRWLGHRDYLTLYVVRRSGVTLADAQSLAASLPNLVVLERGPYLGLMGGRTLDANGCVVEGVQPDGPAALAKLQADDIILDLNGKKVDQFQDLIEQLKSYDVGETITLNVIRAARTLSINVVLGEWSLPDYSDAAIIAMERARQIEAARNGVELDQPVDGIESIDERLFEK